MTTDRELLELAARAAGVTILPNLQASRDNLVAQGQIVFLGLVTTQTTCWNPLTDDGDALRLAVNLSLSIEVHAHTVVVPPPFEFFSKGCVESKTADPYAATRRAIVRAAAEIGRGMS